MIKKLTVFIWTKILQKFGFFYHKNLMVFFLQLAQLVLALFHVLMESGELSNFWSLDYEQFIPVKTALHWMPACIQTVRLLLEWNTDTAPSVPFALRQLLALQSSFNFNNFRAFSALTTGPQIPEQTSLMKGQNKQTKGRGKSTKTMS